MSRFPIGNASFLRFEPIVDHYESRQRLGGRGALTADLLVGERLVRVFSVHLDTRPEYPDDSGRRAQAAEIRAFADDPSLPAVQVVGGDFNTWMCNPVTASCASAPDGEHAVTDFLAAGWLDGTAGYDSYTHIGAGFFPQRLDWLFYRGAAAVPGTCLTDANGSDHFPVLFDLVLE